MKGITPQQRRLVDFVRAYIAKHGHSPNYDEIKAGIGLKSRGNIARMVQCLVERGHLVKNFNQSRSLAVVEGPESLAAICERHLPRLRSVAPTMAREFEEWKARNNGSL